MGKHLKTTKKKTGNWFQLAYGGAQTLIFLIKFLSDFNVQPGWNYQS